MFFIRVFFLLVLAVAFALPAWAKPSVSSAISPEGWRVHTIKFDATTDDSEPFGLGPSCSVRVITYGGSNSVSLYQVPTRTTAASSGSLVGTFSSVSTSATTFRPGQGLAKVVSTSGSDGTVMEVWCSNSEIAAGGGGASSDNDGDGLYEVAYLWDADGDGSGKVLCTAKDTPDPACKASGEVIYRDFADDVNCAMHGGCAGVGQMEQNGLLLLESGVVYVNWPCWDAAESSGFNDPTATDDNLHDSTSDTAYGHCPASPSGTGRRLVTVSLMDWQGTIMGAGTDTRNPETTTDYKRDTGTYIVDDRGPNHNGGGDNVWFLLDGFIRGINFGYENGLNGVATFPAQAGEYIADGDSPGWGEVSGNQAILGFDGAICVADTSTGGSVSADGWAQALEAGDLVMIPSSAMGSDELNNKHVYRVRDTPAATTCNGTGTVSIPLGGRVTSGTAGDYSSNPIFTTQVYDGRFVVAARSDYLQSTATIEDVTIEAQDWWNETSGDCDGSGVWDTTGDDAETDHDCDTNPLVGFWGYTEGGLKNVVMRHWHDRAMDGEAGSGVRRIEGATFLFGMGGQVSDPSADFRFRDIRVFDSQFDQGIFGSFGPNFSVEDLTVSRSTFDYVATLQDSSVSQKFKRIRLLGNAFGNAFRFLCGARNNVFEDIIITGHEDANLNDQNGALARIICDDTAEPIQGNVFNTVHMEGPGQGTGGTGATNCAVVMDADSVIGTSNAGAIRDNRFSNINYVENGDSLNIDASLFCVQDDEASTSRDEAPDYSHEEILADNMFWGNSVQITAGSGTARVYATCGLFDAGGNGSTHRCEDSLNGSGSNGADPNGCMNFENGSAPSVQACE